jgi:hypothetical protein
MIRLIWRLKLLALPWVLDIDYLYTSFQTLTGVDRGL